jgi:catechol 2,3-dioxygenase-like lactoylglutathione lyase family enzyme
MDSTRERVKMIRYNGIHHMAMATGDMDSTIRFWRDLLDMRMVVGMGKQGYRHYFFEVSSNNFLAFFEWPEVEPAPLKDHGFPVKGPLIFDHVSFGVSAEDDLWKLKDNLAAAGFWVSEMIDHGFIRSIYSFDPNGIPIEFSCNVEGVDVREHPVMIDSQPSEITLEGPEPQPGRWPAPREVTRLEEREIYPGEGQELVQGERKNWWKR